MTVLEAISLALTGRSNGYWLGEELNPYWFHRPKVVQFFERLGTDDPAPLPEIRIELYLCRNSRTCSSRYGACTTRKTRTRLGGATSGRAWDLLHGSYASRSSALAVGSDLLVAAAAAGRVTARLSIRRRCRAFVR